MSKHGADSLNMVLHEGVKDNDTKLKETPTTVQKQGVCNGFQNFLKLKTIIIN